MDCLYGITNMSHSKCCGCFSSRDGSLEGSERSGSVLSGRGMLGTFGFGKHGGNTERVGVILGSEFGVVCGLGHVEEVVGGCKVIYPCEGTGPCEHVVGTDGRRAVISGFVGERFGRSVPCGILLASVACLDCGGKGGTCLSAVGSSSAGRVLTRCISSGLQLSVILGALRGLGSGIGLGLRDRTVLRSSRNIRCADPGFRGRMRRLNLGRSVSEENGY